MEIRSDGQTIVLAKTQSAVDYACDQPSFNNISRTKQETGRGNGRLSTRIYVCMAWCGAGVSTANMGMAGERGGQREGRNVQGHRVGFQMRLGS